MRPIVALLLLSGILIGLAPHAVADGSGKEEPLTAREDPTYTEGVKAVKLYGQLEAGVYDAMKSA